MKNAIKTILLLIAVSALVLSLASCDIINGILGNPDNNVTETPGGNGNNGGNSDVGNNDQGDIPEGDDPIEIPGGNEPGDDPIDTPEKTEEELKIEACDTFNGYAALTYMQVNLDIVTVSGGAVLTSSFYLNRNNEVEYSIEQIAKFEIREDGSVIAPDSYISVTEGTLTLSAGNNVVNVNGEFVSIPTYDILLGNFNFDYSNLENYELGDGYASFDVIDASVFFGTETELADMSVKVCFSDNGFTLISVNATLGESGVEYNYFFGEVMA